MARPISYCKNANFEDGITGDFYIMIRDEAFKDCLFVFNDNFKQRNDLHAGAGNACIRPFKKSFQSIGIPTGWSIENGGFHKLGNEERKAIDLAIARICCLNNRFNYKHIFYSADASGKLGKGVFEISEDVLSYITTCLQNIYRYSGARMWKDIREEEDELARLYCPNHFMFSKPSHASHTSISMISKPIQKKSVVQRTSGSTFKKIALPARQLKLSPYFKQTSYFDTFKFENQCSSNASSSTVIPGHSIALHASADASVDANAMQNTMQNDAKHVPDLREEENLTKKKLSDEDDDIEYLLSFVE